MRFCACTVDGQRVKGKSSPWSSLDGLENGWICGEYNDGHDGEYKAFHRGGHSARKSKLGYHPV